MRRLVWGVMLVFIGIVGAAFAVENAAPVTVEYFFHRSEISLAVALLVAFSFGAALGLLCELWLLARQRAHIARLRRRNDRLERELSELRKLPVRERT